MTGFNNFPRFGRRSGGGTDRHPSLVCLALLWGIFFFSVPDDAASFSFPDTSHARRSVLNDLYATFHTPDGEDNDPERQLISSPWGSPVLYRREEQNGNRYDIFIPAGSDDLQIAAPGTYVLRRRIADNAFDQIKIFLQRDEGSFLRLRPEGRTLRMDVHIANTVMYRNVPVPMSMNRALTAPVESLIRETTGIVDWSLLEVYPDESGYAEIRHMVEEIRRALPGLPNAEDGAMDAEGNLVFIESLVSQERLPGFNCSGFAKWVVDGVYRPETGRYLPIEPLKEKHLGLRGTAWSEPLEDARDPYFGLDWTRNLAVHMAATRRNVDPAIIGRESLDVRDVPTAAYVEDVGYPVDALSSVLYWLALREPGTFYLGSVNRLFGEAPVLRQHTHVVVLFPYFDGEGRFHTAVMERNVETDIQSLERRYGDDFIHLVRVDASARFEAPGFAENSLSSR